MQQVTRGIFYEETYLGVTLGGLVFSHGTIFIDAPLRAEDARSWRSMLLNQRGGTNRLLVNLDAHPDRTLGARALDCTIVAQIKTAQVFRNRPTIFKGQNIESGAVWESYSDAIGMRWAAPDITFSDRMALHWGGPEINLEYRPGPTPGSIWAVIPAERVVFVGDAVVANQPPFLAYSDLPIWLEALDLLRTEYKDFTIISGRSGVVTQNDVRAQKEYLQKVEKGVERLSKRAAPTEATEELIPGLLSEADIPPDLRDTYRQRLRYGLFQYYARHHRPSSIQEPGNPEEEEQ